MQLDLFAEAVPEKPALPLIVIRAHPNEGYRDRTIENAHKAHLTFAYAMDFSTAGEQLTKRAAGANYCAIEWGNHKAADLLTPALVSRKATILNVAGNGGYTFAQHKISQETVNQAVYDILKQVHKRAPLLQIVSGGQTGVDVAGAVAGIALGIPIEITLPKGFRQRNEQGKEIYSDPQVLQQQWEAWAKKLT